MSRRQTWLLIGAVCVAMLLCCAAVPTGLWLYGRYTNGSGPLRRDGGEGWNGRAETDGYRFALGVIIRNHHQRTVRIESARLDGLPPTGEPDSSGWVSGNRLLLLDFIVDSPTKPFPVDVGAGSSGHVVVRFRVRCKPPRGSDVKLVLRATIDGQPWEERIGAPIDVPEGAEELGPCP